MTYREGPEKEKLRPLPGPWHKFFEAALVISAAVWFTILNGVGIYCSLKHWLPEAAGSHGIIVVVATILIGVGMCGTVFGFAERRGW